MRVIWAKRVHKTEPGEWWRVSVVSDTEPNSIVTGADIDGMSDDDKLAAGSVIYTPAAIYVAYEDEKFSKSETPELSLHMLYQGDE